MRQIELFADEPALAPLAPDGVPQEVADLFDELARKIRAQGWKRYSSDAILHRIRWHMQIERGKRDFKCNNNWTSALARWWLRQHPEAKGFFELRERRKEEDGTA